MHGIPCNTGKRCPSSISQQRRRCKQTPRTMSTIYFLRHQLRWVFSSCLFGNKSSTTRICNAFTVYTRREVSEARRPHTCSKPCAFEVSKTKKKKHTKSRLTQNTPASKCICFVLETPYGPASYEQRRRYVRHAECAATRRPRPPRESLRRNTSLALAHTRPLP